MASICDRLNALEQALANLTDNDKQLLDFDCEAGTLSITNGNSIEIADFGLQRTNLYCVEGGDNGVSLLSWTGADAVDPPGGATVETWDGAFTGAPIDGIPTHPNTPTAISTIAEYRNRSDNDKDQFQLDAYVFVPAAVNFSDLGGTAEVGAVFQGCCGSDSTKVDEWTYTAPYSGNGWQSSGGIVRVTALTHDFSAFSQFRLQWDLGGTAVDVPETHLWPVFDDDGNKLPCPEVTCTPVVIDCNDAVASIETGKEIKFDPDDPLCQLDCPFPACDSSGGGGTAGPHLELTDDDPLPVGLVADVGTSTEAARADHVHEPLPDFPLPEYDDARPILFGPATELANQNLRRVSTDRLVEMSYRVRFTADAAASGWVYLQAVTPAGLQLMEFGCSGVYYQSGSQDDTGQPTPYEEQYMGGNGVEWVNGRSYYLHFSASRKFEDVIAYARVTARYKVVI